MPGLARAVLIGPSPVTSCKEREMNWDRVEGNWRQLREQFRLRWAALTDRQLDAIAGKRERLAGALQTSYGVSKEEAERQIREWENSDRRITAFEEVLRRSGELV
jgi:uncharacterized protein YjbJ (UPF0337 family)